MAEDSDYSIFSLLSILFTYFINGILMFIVFYLLYKIYKSRGSAQPVYKPEPELPKIKKRDFNLEDLRKYDGTSSAPDGRILIAINGKVFDVTKGKVHYGPGGPYSSFAGRDASRGLAKFSIGECSDGYDDLSDLQPYELESMHEWEMQLKEKYTYVGKLLKPGEEPSVYSDDDGEAGGSSSSSSQTKTTSIDSATSSESAAPLLKNKDE